MTQHVPRRWAALVAAVVVTAGCTVQLGSPSTESTEVDTAPPSSAPTTPGGAPTTSGPAQSSVPRTPQTLSSALLALPELPSGYAVEPATEPVERLVFTAPSGLGGGCTDFVALANAAATPGAIADATISFSGGQDGPFVDEKIEALASAAAVVTQLERMRSSASTCPRVTATLSSTGTSSQMRVRLVSPPHYGSHPLALRLTATGGDLDGFEMTTVATAVGDTVLTLDFFGSYPEDIDATTDEAVAKATGVLGVGTTT